ncbi:hypothetical protein ABH935_001784 [Catenulispora sp. GAS73]|uniref:hypothetical protein n=1 Tax=Catenulispora sp. GAS73 TaxID=3156269 RepID=UPI0035124C99
MNSWINLNALWKIVVIGLLAGAGLPALFAVGLRALSPRGGASGSADPGGSAEASAEAQPDLLQKVAAGICFLAVLAAMGWGVYSIVHNS